MKEQKTVEIQKGGDSVQYLIIPIIGGPVFYWLSVLNVNLDFSIGVQEERQDDTRLISAQAQKSLLYLHCSITIVTAGCYPVSGTNPVS